MRGNAHGRFGGRAEETGHRQRWHRASVRPYYINVRAAERRCVLVVIGCDRNGRKHFPAIEEGFLESAERWKALLLSLRDRGLSVAPKLAVGDGAMGFWSALAEVYPKTGVQRCWVHKNADISRVLTQNRQAMIDVGGTGTPTVLFQDPSGDLQSREGLPPGGWLRRYTDATSGQ